MKDYAQRIREQDARDLAAATAAVMACPEPLIEPVIRTFQKWLYMPDRGPLEVTLGMIAANRMSGDPVWLFLVGPPGSGKTEIVLSLSRLSDVRVAATLTEASLLSGTPTKDRVKNSTGGLLRVVGQFGFIALKDFTSVLSMNRDARGALLAALREIYDGSWTRHVGADGGKTLHWSGKLALIGGCTTAIDSHHSVMATMGERFLLYRMPEISPDEVTDRALSHSGQEKKMRSELCESVLRFFEELRPPDVPQQPQGAERDFLKQLAVFVTRCRSAVERDGYSREISLIHEPEAPTRLAVTLAQLLGGLKAIGVEHDESWTIIRKTAFDSIPPLRRKVLHVLANERREMPTQDIANCINYPTATARRALEDLASHRLLSRRSAGQGKADIWELQEWTEMAYNAIVQPFPKCQ